MVLGTLTLTKVYIVYIHDSCMFVCSSLIFSCPNKQTSLLVEDGAIVRNPSPALKNSVWITASSSSSVQYDPNRKKSSPPNCSEGQHARLKSSSSGGLSRKRKNGRRYIYTQTFVTHVVGEWRACVTQQEGQSSCNQED